MVSNKLRVLMTVLAVALFPASTVLASEALEATFDSNGVPIHYVTKGKGDPLVLVHGLASSAAADWGMTGLLDRLAREFQVIALDNRGHGKSGKPHDTAAYGLEMVDDVVRLLDHLEIEKAHVFGYSMGGFITMKLLERAPERFMSAVVGGAGWSRDSDDWSMMDALAVSLKEGKGILPLIESLQPAGQPPVSAEQAQMMNQMVMSQNDPLALAAAVRGMRELTVAEKPLRANEVPTLAIVGSLDPLKAGVDALDGVMSELEVEVIEGADHITALMNPAYVNQIGEKIRSFVIAMCNCA